MSILVNLDLMLVKRKMKSKTLAAEIGISEQNLSLLKSGKVKGVRFATLDKICEVLDCQPGDLLSFEPNTSQEQSLTASASELESSPELSAEAHARR